jgi:hypothetical protein
VRAEFDIDIQHHWCWLRWRWLKWRWLKWWDSLRCSPVPVVEPRERCEHAYAYDPSRIRQPRMEVPRVGDRIFTLPPTQHSKPNAGPNAGPDEIAFEQMADRVEPRHHREVNGAQIEPYDSNENYRNELPH